MARARYAARMLTEERRQRIADLLDASGSVANEELADAFGVTRMTIYRDLKALEASGRLRRVRGGAVADGGGEEPVFQSKQALQRHEKEAIAAYAARTFVRPRDLVFLEAGTTITAMVRHLAPLAPTVVTNGLAVINMAAKYVPQLTVMACGGMLRERSLTFVGPHAEAFFADVHAHTLFVSGTGLTLPEGLTDPNPLEVQVKRAMAEHAHQVVLLVDSSKLGVRSLVSVLPLDRIDHLVTDEGADDALLAAIGAKGPKVHRVAVPGSHG